VITERPEENLVKIIFIERWRIYLTVNEELHVHSVNSEDILLRAVSHKLLKTWKAKIIGFIIGSLRTEESFSSWP
jgi:hypothetical protein